MNNSHFYRLSNLNDSYDYQINVTVFRKFFGINHRFFYRKTNNHNVIPQKRVHISFAKKNTRAIFKYRAFLQIRREQTPNRSSHTNAIIISAVEHAITLLLPKHRICRTWPWFVDRPTLGHVVGGRWREKARQPRMQMGRLSPSKPPDDAAFGWLKTQISGADNGPCCSSAVIDGRVDACHPHIYGIYYNVDGLRWCDCWWR